MAVHAVSFRITHAGGDKTGLAGPKAFHVDITYLAADILRARLLRLESEGLVEDIVLEPLRTQGAERPIHELLDVIDPMYAAGREA